MQNLYFVFVFASVFELAVKWKPVESPSSGEVEPVKVNKLSIRTILHLIIIIVSIIITIIIIISNVIIIIVTVKKLSIRPIPHLADKQSINSS